MRTLRTVPELRAALAGPRRAGATIALVPTMGAFHAGHLSLMRRSREDCEIVVVSLFVNPPQFDERDDLIAYPRDEARDAALAAQAGVDYLFAPPAAEVYPPGFDTKVSVGGPTATLEGAHRGRGHFDGVTTVVTKLLNMVGPDVAYLGRKDAQQALVIERLVRDLDMPVRIEVCPTVREPDGLAMSSRNANLSTAERERARALHRGLRAAPDVVAAGARDPAWARAAALAVLHGADVEPEYLELVSAGTLTPVQELRGDVLAVIAARIGATRLIDNHMLCAAERTAAAGAENGRS